MAPLGRYLCSSPPEVLSAPPEAYDSNASPSGRRDPEVGMALSSSAPTKGEYRADRAVVVMVHRECSFRIGRDRRVPVGIVLKPCDSGANEAMSNKRPTALRLVTSLLSSPNPRGCAMEEYASFNYAELHHIVVIVHGDAYSHLVLSLARIHGLGRPNTSRARFQERPPRSPFARQRDTFRVEARFPFSVQRSSSSVLGCATAGASAPT